MVVNVLVKRHDDRNHVDNVFLLYNKGIEYLLSYRGRRSARFSPDSKESNWKEENARQPGETPVSLCQCP